ncbi:MAG: response regulator transcription factor [Candidatus Obscuribacterales bacterium]|nr:response regulator transcription factor [Candidatus Obscuribacterales bacterium]
MKSVSTILVEDHEITRIGMRRILEKLEKISIVAESGNGRDAVRLASELSPDLMFIDIDLPVLDGIEATRLIKQSILCKIIIVTTSETPEDIAGALAAGADAYYLKNSKHHLEAPIGAVLSNELWLDPGIFRPLVSLITNANLSFGSKVRNSNRPFHLSEREQDVLDLLVKGYSNRLIAEELKLSAETIKTHMRHLMEKLQVADRTQAAVKALREGLVSEVPGSSLSNGEEAVDS